MYYGLRSFINRALVRPKVGKMVGHRRNITREAGKRVCKGRSWNATPDREQK